MDQAEQLKAVAELIGNAEGIYHAGVPLDFEVGAGYAKLYPTIGGIDYEITVSLRKNTAAAKARYEELRQDPKWQAEALKPGTPEAAQLAELQRKMAGG